MKTILKITLSFLLIWGIGKAQKTDPNSTPPGAPIFEFHGSDLGNRMVPDHPGNAGNRVAVSNFTIIESQSSNVGHNMDQNWRTVLLGMGHNATIVPQTALDNNAFFGATDVLIVSSGIIALSGPRRATIQQFMQTGKSVYIQGEYLTTYSSNQTFSAIVNNTGGTLTLGATVAGDLVPNSVLNLYSNTPNAVSGIGYHWYGATATGCNRFEYFMRYGVNNIGYVYCPTNGAFGDVIQNTDQDWIRSMTSVPLMQNIIFALLSGNACSVVCGILDDRSIDLQADRRADGSVNLQWLVQGAIEAGTFEVFCNDRPIGSVPVQNAAGMTFQFVDQRIPSGIQQYQVKFRDLNGNETMQATATIDLGSVAAHLRVATESQGFRVWLTEGTELQSLALIDAAGKSYALPTESLEDSEGMFVSMELFPPGVYFFQGNTASGAAIGKRMVWLQ